MSSAKYIEGLENRLGRMESLLRLSGLLPDEDDGATDLGTLEKRLAEKAASTQRESGNSVSTPDQDRSTMAADTPRQQSGSPPTESTSPEPPPKTKQSEEEVEALSDMMCSLVTNNCGETRYIGMYLILSLSCSTANLSRVIIWLLNIFTQRHSMGQSEDWGCLVPGNDIKRFCR